MPKHRDTAHEVFLQYHRHRAESITHLEEEDGADPTKIPKPVEPFEMFHQVMKTGVIYVSSRAQRFGFTMEDPEWANMGQGMSHFISNIEPLYVAVNGFVHLK